MGTPLRNDPFGRRVKRPAVGTLAGVKNWSRHGSKTENDDAPLLAREAFSATIWKDVV